MVLAAGLQVDYLPLAALSRARWNDVLGIAVFGAPPDPGASPADIPLLSIDTPVLADSSGRCEIWRTFEPLHSGQHSRVQYRCSGKVLFGCIGIDGTEHDQDGSPALGAATELAYQEIYASLDHLQFPHLLRIWNYLPQINVVTHGLERYRQFNSARRAAMASLGRDVSGNVPAACALGSAGGSDLQVYFLATRTLPGVLENPRQVSAYHYPDQYGPRPAFSRASLIEASGGALLFISGTASIVGHQSQHVGDVAAQTRETLANIRSVVEQANHNMGRPAFALQSLTYKVYVRAAADLPHVQEQLRAALGKLPAALYVQADVCRAELLVEIEAVGRAAD